MSNTGELERVLGTAPKFGLEKKLNLSLCLRPGVRTGCKEERAARAKFDVFHLLTGLIAVDVTVAFVVAPKIYRCA